MAIDKQIPVKPFYYHVKNYVQGCEVEDVDVKCPICLHRFFSIIDDEMVAGEKTNYCSFCEQKMVGGLAMHFESVPLSLAQANAFVEAQHRHHDPVHRDKFRVGCAIGDRIVGVVQVVRPVARGLDDGKTLEVVRLCTDGTKDACSYLYGKAARIAAELGYTRIVTYILASEPGTSLEAAGWHFDCLTKGGNWSCPSRPRHTTAPQVAKKRYSKNLRRCGNDDQRR